jgi:imidazolonepropionase-like amidohydrolase
MRGFTTVRDVGGPTFGLKRDVDEGLIAGPRIHPSGAMISIIGGHGDFRLRVELPRTVGGPLTRSEQIGLSTIADSPDEVRMPVREQLLLGASQIKLTAGGGVASPHSPLDVSTFTAHHELIVALDSAPHAASSTEDTRDVRTVPLAWRHDIRPEVAICEFTGRAVGAQMRGGHQSAGDMTTSTGVCASHFSSWK